MKTHSVFFIQNLNLWLGALLVVMSCTPEETHTHAVSEAKPVHSLMLTESQIRLANIRTHVLAAQEIGQTRIINARLTENESLSTAISSRVAGRIDRLFKKEEGRAIIWGEPLYEIYSENLLTLQQEFLLAHQKQREVPDNKDLKSLAEGSRKKLQLLGMSENQINQLVVLGTAQPRITLLAPTSGIIKSIEVEEGQYVEEGTQLYTLDNLKSLWVEGELYPDDVNWISPGTQVDVKLEGTSPVKSRVEFVSPEYNANTQVLVFRAVVDNPAGKLIPGIPAQITIQQSATSLTVPVSAVIRTASGSHVYVETDIHTYQPRVVQTGLENSSSIEIRSGLLPGENVVVSGAYLLYSEFILKHGTDPTGHQH